MNGEKAPVLVMVLTLRSVQKGTLVARGSSGGTPTTETFAA